MAFTGVDYGDSAPPSTEYARNPLGEADNLAAFMAMPGRWVDRIRQRRSLDKLILDIDSSVSETYGQQEGSA